MSVEFIVSIAIIVMMLMTTSQKRKKLKDRNGSPSFELRDPRKATRSFKERPIQVYLDLSFNTDEYICFNTITELKKTIVKRKFSEFLDIEGYILEYIQHTFPERIQDVPIIDKTEIGSSMNVAVALEKRFKNLDSFLQSLAVNKEFWAKEVLVFLGLETEEQQTNFLAQHDKYLQINKRSIITDSVFDPYEHDEEEKLRTSPQTLYRQFTPKGKNPQPSQANMKRRATYYTESPQIIENYNMVSDIDDFEPNRKMLKVTVVNYK